MPSPLHSGVKAKLDAVGRKLWHQGLTDPQIGDILGCHKTMVWWWRKRNGLPCNAPTGSGEWHSCRTTMVDGQALCLSLLNDAEMDDKKICQTLGITRNALRKRKRRLGPIAKEKIVKTQYRNDE